MKGRGAKVKSGRIGTAELMAQALQHHQQGKLDLAASRCNLVLKTDPQHFDALHFLAVLRALQGRPSKALELIDAALEIVPSSASAWSNRGLILARLGCSEEALSSYDKAIAIEPNLGDALENRGRLLFRLSRLEEAVADYDRVIATRPRSLDALCDRGDALGRLGRPAEALASYDRALAIKSECVEALCNRGNVLVDLRRYEDALASFDKVIALALGNVEAWRNRGSVLLDLRDPEEALASFDRAIALAGDDAEAFDHRGTALVELNRLPQALASYDRAIALDQGSAADAMFHRGMTSLLMGDFAAGWTGFERRFERRNAERRKFDAPVPHWRGEALNGKRLIVYEEQGLGDIIQFARYLPLLAAQGAEVSFQLRPALHRLLRSLGPDIRLIGAPLENEAFDYQCALMSLPHVTGTRLDSIPADGPYLRAEESLSELWRRRFAGPGLFVGIAWQGNPQSRIDIGRSIPLQRFAPLAEVPGVRLISLQKTHGLDQLAHLPAGMAVETLGPSFDGGPDAFIDTAAAMMGLDLIVTSDTSIAHLAGALGRPVWLALKLVPDWRWLLERADSPWYPSMTLYRQRVRNDWNEVFARMAADLVRFKR